MRVSGVFLACALLLSALACNNYDLQDSLENPGGKKAETFTDRLYVFVTSQTTTGDMQNLAAGGCTGNGIARADCVCQNLAQQSNRRMAANSRFVAWLSTTGSPDNEMLCRILGGSGAGCVPTGNSIWYNTMSVPVFAGMGALFSSSPSLSGIIAFTENAVPVASGAEDVWTGTAQQGTANVSNCGNWSISTNTNTGLAGKSSNTDFAWTNSATQNCDAMLRVICFAVP